MGSTARLPIRPELRLPWCRRVFLHRLRSLHHHRPGHRQPLRQQGTPIANPHTYVTGERAHPLHGRDRRRRERFGPGRRHHDGRRPLPERVTAPPPWPPMARSPTFPTPAITDRMLSPTPSPTPTPHQRRRHGHRKCQRHPHRQSNHLRGRRRAYAHRPYYYRRERLRSRVRPNHRGGLLRRQPWQRHHGHQRYLHLHRPQGAITARMPSRTLWPTPTPPAPPATVTLNDQRHADRLRLDGYSLLSRRHAHRQHHQRRRRIPIRNPTR